MKRSVRAVALVAVLAAVMAGCTHHGGGRPPHGSTTTTAPVGPPANPATVRASGPTSGKTPVIFVHGYAEDAGMWNVAVEKFKAAGYQSGDITVLVFDTHTLNATQAAGELATEVDYLRGFARKPKVDIVAHSLGDLVTKACIVQGGCQNKVAHWENLAGAQNGTELALQCPEPACVDMQPGSALITALQAADDAAIAAQHVKVQVQWTPNDGVIVPPEASKEPYADNVQIDSSLTHLDMFLDPGVLARSIAFLAS